jgi:pimeloyl-ACP methyl ester carboxylesterase
MSSTRDKGPGGSPSVTDVWIETEGVGVAVRDHGGTGPDLVLLHGIGGNLETMEPLSDRLGRDHRVVAIDLPGCGQSDPFENRSGDPFRAMATIVRGVADALGLEEPDLLGHSLGGMVAARYMAIFGGRPPRGRLVSIDGFPPGCLTVADPDGRSLHRDWLLGARRELEALTAEPVAADAGVRDEMAEGLRAWLVAVGFTPPNLAAVVDRQFVALSDGTFRRRPDRSIVEGGFAAHRDVLADYRSAAAATLIVRCTGWAPPPIDIDLADLHASRAGVEIVHLDGSHLAPAWQSVDEVTDLVRSFWQRHPRS